MRMLQMISEGHKPRIRDFGTPKRYYNRMLALMEAQLVAVVIKKDVKGKRSIKKYELTPVGLRIYKSLPMLRKALSLYWKLNALDALDKEVPLEGYNKLMQSLMQDETIRNILQKS